MKMMLTVMIATFALAMVVGCDSNESNQADSHGTPPARSDQRDGQTQPVVPTDARQVQPLDVGDQAAVAILRRPDGQAADLADLYGRKPTVLIFYRGGWCPYCNAHLGQIAAVEPELLKMGYQVLAISPDRPEELAKTLDKQHLTYQLLSDSDAVLARAFGLVFRVDDPTLEKYRGFGIDLEQASGQDHHLLPVPAVYIVDTTGTIRFAHWDSDYKTRLAPEDLLKAARESRRFIGKGGAISWNFDSDRELPLGWKIAATKPKGDLAEWKVVADDQAPSAPNVLTITRINDDSRGVFNLLWTPTVSFQDGTIELKLRANTGRVDQGGGPIWRAKDFNNYYIARYNPLEGNFRLYYVKNGARKTLDSAGRISIKAGEWFTIKIVHKGEKIEGWLNGKKLLETKDRTFRQAGGVGFWTKADAATSFDGLSVKPDR